MARRQVVEVVCDRCSKVETQGIDEDPNRRSKNGKEFELTFHSRTIEYEDLCIRCRKAIDGYVKQISKEVEPKAKKDEPVHEPKQETKKGLLNRIAG